MKILRGIVSLLVVCFFVYLVFSAFLEYTKCGEGMQKLDLSDFARQKAIDEYLEYNKFYTGLAMAVIAALWALIFAGKVSIKSSKWQERLLIISIVMGFLSSMFCHFQHMHTIITRAFEAEVIELSAPILRFWFNWQIKFFYYQFLAFLIFSAFVYFRQDKEKEQNN